MKTSQIQQYKMQEWNVIQIVKQLFNLSLSALCFPLTCSMRMMLSMTVCNRGNWSHSYPLELSIDCKIQQ